MKKILLSVLFGFFCINIFSLDEGGLINTAQTLVELSKIYAAQGKPDKITIAYNAFLLVLSEMKDKDKLKQEQEYFTQVIQRNKEVFKELVISIEAYPRINTINTPSTIKFPELIKK